MKTVLFLALLMSTASTFAQTGQISEEEVALMREPYEWNGPFTQTDYRLYVATVGYKGGYNMGPLSKYGIMKGMAQPMQGSGGFKWDHATALCFPQRRSSTAGFALLAANIVTQPTW